ncbi:LysR family transcriptional regulator [Actinotalea sp. M2MS4P-6]|uniref:LysR family transcriptional regulator n=1 Tax=Actinotalea sp. M2MS4P-6 TaxID=2983762 RepID=UPI0021E43CEF|nr:LysR family transcriptional regulator [Actinotalea sp. M2MS4P-6]MCV2396200.1 LysR family transcriptional regulator [Actinotalea sp. M2MS4P-6]
MDVRHLELLRELADRGTVTAVAEATFRSPSAVSQQLRSAERAFGVALVEPDGRGLRLTTAGRLLADGAVGVATELGRLQRELDDLRGRPSGLVRIAGLPSAVEFLAPGLVSRLAGTGVDVALTDEDVAEADYASRAADHDLVIAHSLAEAPAGSDRLVTRTIAREPLDVAVPASHRLAGHRTLLASDLAAEAWIGVPLGYPFDTVRIAIEHRAGVPLEIVQRIRDNRVVEALVASGRGCALLPRFTTRPRPGVVLVPLSDVRAVRSIVALGRPDRLERAAVRVALAALVESGREVEGVAARH